MCLEKKHSNQRICVVGETNYTIKYESNEKNKWLLDSGASTHACNSKSMFVEMIPESSSIVVGDDREVIVTGHGTVKLEVLANNVVNTIILNDVALVPELGVNLVSTGRLECQGLKIITESGMSKIF